MSLLLARVWTLSILFSCWLFFGSFSWWNLEQVLGEHIICLIHMRLDFWAVGVCTVLEVAKWVPCCDCHRRSSQLWSKMETPLQVTTSSSRLFPFRVSMLVMSWLLHESPGGIGPIIPLHLHKQQRGYQKRHKPSSGREHGISHQLGNLRWAFSLFFFFYNWLVESTWACLFISYSGIFTF